jgi:signal transduction histidine kinase
LGHIFHLQKRDADAVTNYEAALSIYELLNNKINAADVLMSLSQVYKDGNQLSKAKPLLLEALAYRSRSQDIMSTLAIKMALAEIEIKEGDLRKGIAFAEECLASFEEMGNKEGLRDAHLLLADAYAQSGNFKKAYLSLQSFSVANDSLTSVERAEAIKKYDLLITTERKDKEIAEQKVEIEKQQVEIQKRNNQLLMLGGGLVLIALFSALLFFIYYKNKQLHTQKIQVLKKEQETQRLKSIIEGEEKERKRVARELHDGLGAVLATVKMEISGIRHKLPEAQVLIGYQKAESLIDIACRTVREISHDLMPHVLEQQGLIFAIDDLCQTLANHNEVAFDFIHFGNEGELSDVLKITIFRITQELLKNIIKHAEAKEVIVQLTIEEDKVMLVVEDDGKGFDTSIAYQGIGLKNIRSRTAYLNGTLEIDSSAKQGSTFTILLPLNQELKLKI